VITPPSANAGLDVPVPLYVVNFQILGRTAFPWFQEGPDRVFELGAHAGFGLLLVRFFLSRPSPRGATDGLAEPKD
jgi:hypothetical protein